MHVTPHNRPSIINLEPRNHPVEKANQHINLPGCIKSRTKNSEKFHSVKSEAFLQTSGVWVGFATNFVVYLLNVVELRGFPGLSKRGFCKAFVCLTPKNPDPSRSNRIFGVPIPSEKNRRQQPYFWVKIQPRRWPSWCFLCVTLQGGNDHISQAKRNIIDSNLVWEGDMLVFRRVLQSPLRTLNKFRGPP